MRNKEELLEIARMAKLSLASDEIDSFYCSITEVMKVIETINELDLDEYDCSEDVQAAELREDVVVPSLPVELVLSGADKAHDGFFTV